jgi:hypothetical protein
LSDTTREKSTGNIVSKAPSDTSVTGGVLIRNTLCTPSSKAINRSEARFRLSFGLRYCPPKPEDRRPKFEPLSVSCAASKYRWTSGGFPPSVRDDGLADPRQPPMHDGTLRKMMMAFRKLCESGDMIRGATDTTAYGASPRDDQIRFAT